MFLSTGAGLRRSRRFSRGEEDQVGGRDRQRPPGDLGEIAPSTGAPVVWSGSLSRGERGADLIEVFNQARRVKRL